MNDFKGISRRTALQFACATIAPFSNRLYRLFFASPRPAAPCIIAVSADSMRHRVADFRSKFVSDYLRPEKPFPVFGLMAQANALPNDVAVAKKLGARGAMQIANGHMRNSAPSGSGSIVAIFDVDLSGAKFPIKVIVPESLDVSVSDDGTRLLFAFNTQVLIELTNQPVVGVPIHLPGAMLLKSISLSDDAFQYELVDRADPSRTVAIRLNLKPGAPVNIDCAGNRDASGIFRRFLGVTVLVFLALPNIGCVNHGNAPPGAYEDIELCYSDPNIPTGYIRISSHPGGLAGCPQTSPNQSNVFVYKSYLNLQPGDSTEVCADAPVPNGFEDISGAFRDDAGCDHQIHPESTYLNARTIRKCTDPTRPECQH
jgi:hypothetical protein